MLDILRRHKKSYTDLGKEKTAGLRLTERELRICEVTGAKWITMDVYKKSVYVCLWSKKPLICDGVYIDGEFIDGGKERSIIAQVSRELFPSIHPGDCIEL